MMRRDYGSILGFILLTAVAGALAAFISGHFKLAYLISGVSSGSGVIAWRWVKSSVLTYGILLNTSFLIGMGIVHLLMNQAGYLK